RRFQQRWWLHLLLFVLTVASTSNVGLGYYYSFLSDFRTRVVTIVRSFVLHGFVYGAAVLGILGAHEAGHYVACRRYDVDATLPFFLPFVSLSGTLGAVIKIREAFPSRRALFDIAIAGPIGGFIVLIPLLFWGMARSN